MTTATKATTEVDELQASVKRLRRAWDAVEADRVWFEKRYPSHEQAQRLYRRRLAELNEQLAEAERRLAAATTQ